MAAALIHPMRALRGIAAQLLGLLIALLFTRLFEGDNLWTFLAIQATGAALLSRWLGQAIWWIPIHLFFLPTAVSLLALNISPLVYLAIFSGMALVFWGTAKGDVPLFLSSPVVAEALDAIMVREQTTRLAELGAGVGSVAIPLALRQPSLVIDAWEKAPLPWLILAWRARKLPNMTARCGSFWTVDLNRYDVVFAFLSPLVMHAIKEKVRREMRPGTLLISSSFPAPDWNPEEVKTLGDTRKTHLYCYRI